MVGMVADPMHRLYFYFTFKFAVRKKKKHAINNAKRLGKLIIFCLSQLATPFT